MYGPFSFYIINDWLYPSLVSRGLDRLLLPTSTRHLYTYFSLLFLRHLSGDLERLRQERRNTLECTIYFVILTALLILDLAFACSTIGGG